MVDKIKDLGQVFTLPSQVQHMLELRQNFGSVLEPSVGDGAIYNALENTAVGIEFDSTVCPDECHNMDFFDYCDSNKFDTIIANPPYVKGKRIVPETREKLQSNLIPIKNNLYLHFIEKCFQHLNDGGELIFINPMDFLQSTGSEKLNNLLMEHGTITHMYDLSGENIFRNANPDSCCIWRFEKGNFTRRCVTKSGLKKLIHHNGKIYITNKQYTCPFADLFYCKVGGVPGQKDRFFKENGRPFVYSKTRTLGDCRGMDYRPSEWVRALPNQADRDNTRIYVNCKTLTKDPFFYHECKDWDGSVIAIFPRDPTLDPHMLVELFNSVDWEDLGFMWHGKYVFSHGALTKCLLPPEFNKLRQDITC